MTKRSTRIPEISEHTELSCVWGLFHTIESREGRNGHKMISNGRHVNKEDLIDYPRNPLASFDEECRKIQNPVGRLSSETSRNLIQENIFIQSHENEQTPSNSAEMPSNSAEMPSNKLIIDRKFVENQETKSKYNPLFETRESSNPNKDSLLEKTNTGFMPRPDKIVILKPSQKTIKNSENVTFNCSSLNSHQKSSGNVSSAKPAHFSFREVKRRFKNTFTSHKFSKKSSIFRVGDGCIYKGVDTKNTLVSTKNPNQKENISKKTNTNDTVRQKIDVSSVKLSKEQAYLAAKLHLSARVQDVNAKEISRIKNSPKTLARILSSPEHDLWPISPRRDVQYCSVSSHMRPSKEVKIYDHFRKYENLDSEPIRSTDDEGHGEVKMVEMNRTDVTSSVERSGGFELDDGSVMHSLTNETSSSTLDDFSSTPTSSHRLETSEIIKYQEEHQSPVSVLDPLFTEDANSPSNVTLQTDERSLQPRFLDFEECSIDLNPIKNEQDYISKYVLLVLEASCLDWDRLSEIGPQPEEIIDPSLFYAVEFWQSDATYFDPLMLFGHVNEILLEVYECHFCPPPWLASVKPRIVSFPLQEFVLDEVMKETEFYILPRTEKRTLNQLVSKDVAKSRTWLDCRLDVEQIVIQVSEEILEESVFDILLELCT